MIALSPDNVIVPGCGIVAENYPKGGITMTEEERDKADQEANAALEAAGLNVLDDNGRPLWQKITHDTVEVVREIYRVDISVSEGRYWAVYGYANPLLDVPPSDNMHEIKKRLAERHLARHQSSAYAPPLP